MSRAAMALLASLLWSACLLGSPSYDETSFTCNEPPHICPLGYDCVDGLCVRSGEAADTGVPEQPQVDAAPATPDAVPADAAIGPTTEVTLSGTGIIHDTYIRLDSPLDNFGGRSVVSIDADPVQIGLIHFDLSSIPTTAQIVSAELVVYINDPIEDGQFVSYRLLEAWHENEATYTERKAGVLWASPGAGEGSYDPNPVFVFAPPVEGLYTIDLLPATVQLWVAQPETNFGLKWVSNSQAGRGGQFHSSENSADPPVLRIRYR